MNNKIKLIIRYGLLLFVVASIVFAFTKQVGNNKTLEANKQETVSADSVNSSSKDLNKEEPSSTTQPGVIVTNKGNAAVSLTAQKTDKVNSENTAIIPAAKGKIIAYYFHGTARCQSCLKIEKYSKEAIDATFGKELQSGTLEWKVINVDEMLNKHFIDDYKLYTKSLVISEVKGDKEVSWKNLEKVWEYLGDTDKFHSYVQQEINTYLSEIKK